MVGWLSFLWFVTCVGVMAYGLSNHSVDALRLPRWTSIAVAGLGFSMLMAMFAFSMVALAHDVTWFVGDGGGGGFGRGGGD